MISFKALCSNDIRKKITSTVCVIIVHTHLMEMGLLVRMSDSCK